jgi:hypothetical protein
VKDYSRHLTRFTLCNLAVSPRFLQGFHKKIAWPTDTRFSMVAERFRELVEFMICEFAILDNGVTGLETHFYRNHSWIFFKVFGLGGNGFWTIPRSASSSHSPESAGELPLCILQDAGKKDWRAAAEFLRLGFREDDSVRADIVVDG